MDGPFDINAHMLGKAANPAATRKALLTRLNEMEKERRPWLDQARNIAAVVQPWAGRFTDTTPSNDGSRRNADIINNTATLAHRATSAGFMSNASSPARDWFRLGVLDPDLNRRHSVRLWFDQLTKLAMGAARRSGTYRALHHIYSENPLFGTAADIIAPDSKTLLRHMPMTFGEYCIAVDYTGRPDTIFRKFDMTVGQAIAEFGFDKCSKHVQTLARRGLFDHWIKIVHAIEPRVVRKYTSLDNLDMPWRSIYFEEACAEDQILRESGFTRFPAIAPRWQVLGLAAYGFGPGHEALPDTLALQQKEFRKAQAIDFQTEPPTQGPPEMAGREIKKTPGAHNTVSDPTGAGIRPIWEVHLELQYLMQDIKETEQRIYQTWYADLFRLMQMLSDTTQRTRQEILERSEERLLAVGPVVERLTDEALEPIVDFLVEAVLPYAPPPPPELEGQEMVIEFISPMAQAQKAIGANSIDRMIGTIRVLAEAQPEAMDKLNVDETIDSYSDMIGVDPRMIVPGNKVALVRKARAQAQAAVQQAETAAMQASAAKDAATALQASAQNSQADVIGQFAGYNSPQPQGVI